MGFQLDNASVSFEDLVHVCDWPACSPDVQSPHIFDNNITQQSTDTTDSKKRPYKYRVFIQYLLRPGKLCKLLLTRN